MASKILFAGKSVSADYGGKKGQRQKKRKDEPCDVSMGERGDEVLNVRRQDRRKSRGKKTVTGS